ncbi:MAG: threonylcarbamoyl-AMP synthase [Ekhidna sp.]|nr:threonylcarbamoyl-AMP synthase [Ekhidna sp.]
MAAIGIDIQKAKKLLRSGEVVGIPTETVYGLAGNALNEESILQIFSVKNRPKFDPLIAHVDSLHKVEQLVDTVPEVAGKLADKFWPGPLTLLLDKIPKVPNLLTSGHSRIAVRIPDHPLTLSLLSQLAFPLAAPSANPFGYVSPTTADHVNEQLGDKIPYVLDGGSCEVGVESTIIGFEEDEAIIYRLGGISLEEVREVTGKVMVKVNSSSDPSAPGMLKSHYSPGKKLLIGDIAENITDKDTSAMGVISFKTDFSLPEKNQFVLSPRGNLNEAAQNIFKALRKMDQPHIKKVFAEWAPDEGLGRAINDRLKRASI